MIQIHRKTRKKSVQYTFVGLEERILIKRCLLAGLAPIEIAEALSRPIGTVTLEIERHGFTMENYDPYEAHVRQKYRLSLSRRRVLGRKDQTLDQYLMLNPKVRNCKTYILDQLSKPLEIELVDKHSLTEPIKSDTRDNTDLKDRIEVLEMQMEIIMDYIKTQKEIIHD